LGTWHGLKKRSANLHENYGIYKCMLMKKFPEKKEKGDSIKKFAHSRALIFQ
jgi:hypothetical protein